MGVLTHFLTHFLTHYAPFRLNDGCEWQFDTLNFKLI